MGSMGLRLRSGRALALLAPLSAIAGRAPPVEATPPPGQDTRLVGGTTPNQGRVEIWYAPPGKNASWSTVCDDGWDIVAAHITCKHLGYPGARRAVQCELGTCEFGYGPPSMPVGISNVICKGDEDSIFECSFFSSPNCRHTEDAGVECFGSTTESPPPPPSPTPPPPFPPGDPPPPPPPPSRPPPSPRPMKPVPHAPPPSPRAPPSWVTVQETFARYNTLLSENSWFSFSLFLLLGSVFAALLASCCVFVEVVSYTVASGDRRLRFRLGCCCWLTPSDTDVLSDPPAYSSSSTYMTPAPPAKPMERSWLSKTFGWGNDKGGGALI